MAGPTVLSVLPDAPFPATTGLQLRLAANLRVVRELAGTSHVLWFGDPGADRDLDALEDACDAAVFAGSPVPYSSFSPAARVGQRLGFVIAAARRRRGRRYPSSVVYDAVGAERTVRDTARRTGPDFVVLPAWFAHYAPGLAAEGQRVIIDAYDVLTDQTLNLLRTHGLRHPRRLPGLLANHIGSRSQERLCLPACAEVWANSETQARRLRELAPGARVIVVGNVLDGDAVTATPLLGTYDVGFISAYSYPPNTAAARHLALEVLPRLRRGLPAARLLLAGAGMDETVRAELAAVEGVELLGRVPDSGAFMESCSAMAYPLFFRSGPPLKVVEALARGRPVVASPQVAEALGLSDGRELLVARRPGAAANALARVLTDSTLAARLAQEGRRAFEERFSLRATVAAARRDSMLAEGRALAG